MTSRERIQSILAEGKADRVGMDESPWTETMTRWRTEGLPEGTSVQDYFGMDLAKIGGFDVSFRFPTEVIEDTEEYSITKDANGVTAKRIKRESGHTPHWMDHTIETRADWEENVGRLEVTENRVAADMEEKGENARKSGRFVCVNHADPYEISWPIFGQVGIFTLMMDDPDLIASVFMKYADMLVECHEILRQRGVEYDGVFMYTDLGYRNATLFAPRLYDELLFPAHKKYCDYLASRGKPLICHSCGKIDVLIPRFIEAGFAAIQPLEAKCGQDVRDLGKDFGGQITFFGNMDVRKLSGTKQDVHDEVVPKLEAAKKFGGYIWHSDHSVPPTVSWENYCYAIELVKKHGRY